MSLGQQQGKGICPKSPSKEEELWVWSRGEAAPGWRADGTWGQGETFCPCPREDAQKHSVAVRATQLAWLLFFPTFPYPLTPFLGGLLLNCLVCLCLNLGGPLRGVVGPVGASPVLRLAAGVSLIAGLCAAGTCLSQIPLPAR